MKLPPVRSVKRALDLLSVVAFEDEGPGLALRDLARRMELPPNSTHNLLKSMAAAGYVAQNAEGRYVAGPRCRQLSRIGALRGPDALCAIERAVADVSRRLGESVVFATLADGARRLLAHADPDRAVRVDVSQVRGPDPFAFVTGKVLVAYATADERARAVERNGWPAARWDHIRDAAALERSCAAIRERGSASAANAANETFSIACPVLDRGGALVGALGCFAPEYRCLKPDRARILRALQAAAARLGRGLASGGGTA